MAKPLFRLGRVLGRVFIIYKKSQGRLFNNQAFIIY